MKRFWFVGLALATALAATPAAKADPFTISFSGSAVTNPLNPNCCAPSISGSGVLTGVPDVGSPGSFDITGTVGSGISVNIGVDSYTASLWGNGENPSSPITPTYYPTPPPNDYFAFDNVVTPQSTSPSVDQYGLLFQLAGTGTYAGGFIEFYSSGPSGSPNVIWWDLFWPSDPNFDNDDGFPIGDNNGGYGVPLDNFSINPEPSSFLLFGTGLLGLAAFLYRRKQTA